MEDPPQLQELLQTMPQTSVKDLSDEALLRALRELYAIRGVPVASARDDLPRIDRIIRVQTSLEIVANDHSQAVYIATDGAVTLEAIKPAPSEARVSPGLARMRANLGTEGTENLRKQVVDDGDAALAAAARRTDHLSEVPADVSGDAAAASAAASKGEEASPEAAAALGDAVARALRMMGKSVPDLLKALEKETNPQARTMLKNYLAEAQRKSSETMKASARAPAPRKATTTASPRAKATDFSATDIIHLKVPAGTNPKRATAAARFAKYVHGMTVAEYGEAIGDTGQAGRDITWDREKGWIEIVRPEAK